MKKIMIGYQEAIQNIFDNIEPLESEIIPLAESGNRVLAADLFAKVNSPTVNASLKDGYAVRSHEIDFARPNNPVTLKVLGTASAGRSCDLVVTEGTTIRILTGAQIPEGADAVVSEEFTCAVNGTVNVTNFAELGRNILLSGSDVSLNDCMGKTGDRLSPGMAGLLAASGFGDVPVFLRPRVAIIATGDEVVIPGQPLPKGKIYASNLVTLNTWCLRYGIKADLCTVSDKPDEILEALEKTVETHDAVLTSGGAWTGDRDFVVQMLETLGWKQFFHRIRIGPGKAVGFGLLRGKPIFVLPGGPPSNLLAFLNIALPGLMMLGGFKAPELPSVKVKLTETVMGRDIDWTQYIFGCFENGNGHTHFKPMKLKSRLQSMGTAQGVIAVPEGTKRISAGSIVSAQILS
jgi:molybdopterin molybdotransferase